jgi:purine-nucleoside phosphorylase
MTTSIAAAEFLRRRGIGEPVDLAVLLGAGLSALGEGLEDALVLPYSALPGFPQADVPEDGGRLAIGVQEGVRVAYLQGGRSGGPDRMKGALETLALLGAWGVLLTGTGGSLRQGLYPGNIAMISDHINFSGINPLAAAQNSQPFSLADAYDPKLRQRLKAAGAGTGVSVQEAIYMWIPGPSCETPAEARAARQLGAEAVGASLVPEVILARRLGLRVAALAVITNYAAGFSGGAPNEEQTQRAALGAAIGLKRLVRNFLRTKTAA